MKIRTKNESAILLVMISGKFNIEEVVKFEEAISFDSSKGISAIAIDFTEVEYIDSSALGSLIKLMNKAKNVNIEFILYNMSQPIMSIFRLAYLDKFFSITTTDALEKKYPGVAF
ncbi:MAG TPA: STAS domain-containing protein [Spirochaetota bacterium]